ncbi:MAG: hypothetical protein R3E48_05135 [Burkholderiaceae bacterium]
MATWDLREAANLSAMELPPEEDGFIRAGVTKAACIDAPVSRVAEGAAHFECRYLSTHRLFVGRGRLPADGVEFEAFWITRARRAAPRTRLRCGILARPLRHALPHRRRAPPWPTRKETPLALCHLRPGQSPAPCRRRR